MIDRAGRLENHVSAIFFRVLGNILHFNPSVAPLISIFSIEDIQMFTRVGRSIIGIED